MAVMRSAPFFIIDDGLRQLLKIDDGLRVLLKTCDGQRMLLKKQVLLKSFEDTVFNEVLHSS